MSSVANAVPKSVSVTPSSKITQNSGNSAESPPVNNTRREVQVSHKDFPDAKTLLISCKRTRPFLERTARELLAGGTKYIVLSALGDAIPLCILLEASLQEKNVAKSIRIETTSDPSRQSSRFATPGLRIVMEKHPNFKGSRISPGYVSFCTAGEGEPVCWDQNGTEYLASVFSGNKQLFIAANAEMGSFFQVLEEAGLDVAEFETVHQALLENAIKENADKPLSERRAIRLNNIENDFPDFKLGFCRPNNYENTADPNYLTGSVFITLFKKKFPLKNSYNLGMVYLIPPNGKNYKEAEDFLEAVSLSAENLMTTLCDHNGFARREQQKIERSSSKSIKYERIASCRVDLFSDDVYKHLNVTRYDIAKSILEGLARGYRHGPAPRINFVKRDSLFEQVWEEAIGREHVTSLPNKQQNGVEA